jgi:hypothetical protein
MEVHLHTLKNALKFQKDLHRAHNDANIQRTTDPSYRTHSGDLTQKCQ